MMSLQVFAQRCALKVWNKKSVIYFLLASLVLVACKTQTPRIEIGTVESTKTQPVRQETQKPQDEKPAGGLLEVSQVSADTSEMLEREENNRVLVANPWGSGDFSEGLAAIRLSNKCGWIDTSGKLVIKPRFNSCGEFREGVAFFSVAQGSGLIDKSGEVVLEPILGLQRPGNTSKFSEGLAAVRVDSKWGFIDKTGQFVIEPQFDSAQDFSQGLALVELDDQYGFIDKTGKVVVEMRFGYVKEFSDGLAAVRVDSKWGFIDKTGQLVIEPQFEWAEDFSEGLAAARVDSKRGYIDKTGKLVIEPPFDSAKAFSDGLARVKLDEKWGYIDKTGQLVIDCQFDYAHDFSEGLAVVLRDESDIENTVAYIDQKGDVAIAPTFTYADAFSNTEAFGARSILKLLAQKPKIDRGLANVHYADGVKLSEEAKERLSENGFVVVPQFGAQLFSSYIDSDLPVFITTDSAFHAYHGLLNNYLDEVELQTIFPQLKTLAEAMLVAAREQAKTAPAGEVKNAATINVAVLSVVLKILNPEFKLPMAAGRAATRELKLITQHTKQKASPIFGYSEDYTVYKPRFRHSEHMDPDIAKQQEQLKKYFVAMTYLSRMGFRLNSNSQTLSAILLADIVSKSPKIRELFNSITRFKDWFGGSPDDLSIEQYIELLEKVYGKKRNLKSFTNAQQLRHFIEVAQASPDPQINTNLLTPDQFENAAANTKGLRLIGSGFTIEAHAFAQLTDPNVTQRYMPSALDIMAMMGVDPAEEIQQHQNSRFPDYSDRLLDLQTELDNKTLQYWFGDHSLATLWTLRSLFPLSSDGLPYFMQGEPWAAKSLNTALGGWAVIYHDTAIYRKGNYAICGIYDDFSGFVEPNPEFYNRLILLIKASMEKLTLSSLWKKKFESLMMVMEQLRRISKKELEGEPFTVGDQFFIEEYGKTIAGFFGYNNNQAQSPDKSCAIISDVFTEGAVLQKCLQVGIGPAMQIYVVLNVNGDAVLSRGGVFSFYEFEQDMSNRLTDDEWMSLWQTRPLDFQEWQKSFISLEKTPLEKTPLSN